MDDIKQFSAVFRLGTAACTYVHETDFLLGGDMQSRIQTPTWVAASGLGLALLIGVLTGATVHSSSEQPTYTAAADTRTQVVFDQGFSPVVKKASPAVVNI